MTRRHAHAPVQSAKRRRQRQGAPRDMAERVARTNEVLARFRHRPLSYERRATCLHLFRAQAVAMGHEMPPIPLVRSATSALRALKAHGHESLESLIDALLPGRRIPPARLWAGDVVLLPGEPFEAVTIATGAGAKVMGWHHGNDLAEMVAIDLSRDEWANAVIGAWRLG